MWKKSELRTAIVGLMLMTILAACGTSPAASDDGVASLDGDAAATATTLEDPQAPSDPDEAFALFEACMAENGVDLPSPDSGEGGLAVTRGQSSSGETSVEINGVEIDPEVFDAAEAACRPHLANIDQSLDLTPEQEAAMEDANLAFQECMDDHGIEGVFAIGPGDGPSLSASGEAEEADPQAAAPGEGEMVDEEELQAATEECMKVFDVPELEELFGEPRD